MCTSKVGIRYSGVEGHPMILNSYHLVVMNFNTVSSALGAILVPRICEQNQLAATCHVLHAKKNGWGKSLCQV